MLASPSWFGRVVPLGALLLLTPLLATPAAAQRGPANPLRPAGPPSAPSAADPRDVSMGHLRGNRARLGLSQSDLDEVVVEKRHRDSRTGVTHLYLRQQLDGIDVAGAVSVMAVGPQGRLLSHGDRFERGLRARLTTRMPRMSPESAALAAAQALGIPTPARLAEVRAPGGDAREVVFEASGISRDEIPARLAFVATDAGPIRITWNLVIRTPDGRHWWNLFVDAETGATLRREDWIARDTYEVYPVPLTSPDEGPRSVIVDPPEPGASPFGWHDTNGVTGAEFTDTRGNNVFAQEDVDANDTGGFRPDGGPMLEFEFPLDSTLHPSSYQPAAIANLFYWNNALHDILYQYGFDEAAGNFQENNYGNGGLGGDPVQADAQDGSDINNAQFGTPPDGQDPRMEMFLFTQFPGPLLQVTAPAGIAGSYPASGGTFGGGASGLTGAVVQALDPADVAGPSTTDACSPLTNAGAVAGNIALVDRGTCLFVEKTATVQAAGAIGIVIVNNAGDALVNMGGADPSLVIPPLFIGQTDGATIQAQLGAGVTAAMTAPVPRGSSFDNGVVAHEYGHGLSNRLTGGAANSGCLNTTQSGGMGEGWSDWLALMVTAQSADTALDPKAVGTYALGEPPTGAGFRNFPYSRDLSVTPLTLSDIATLNQPHGIGEVWASALYDLYWNLVDHYGFQPNLLLGSGGNGLSMQLVINAMKLQPCDPNFLEARDALLLADDIATGAENSCLIWEAFSRRGMGESATSGSSTTTTVGEAFDEPAACQNECGDGALQPGEQCDDGGTASFDGCTANCRDETLLPLLVGTAAGGSVSATIDGVVVQVTTSAGQTGAAVATALAAAINADTALQGVYVVADAQGSRAAISGNLDSFVIDDPGFDAVGVPALGAAGRGLLAAVLIALAGGLGRRRRLGASPAR